MISASHRSRSTEGIDGKDSVGLYLDGIAKTPLLTAEEEVMLAREIEAGLYAEAILDGTLTTKERGGRKAAKASDDELRTLVNEGEQAMRRFVTANLRLVDLLGDKAFVATDYDGKPLAEDHGGPARLVVPGLYFWKSAKWLRGLLFSEFEYKGYWEKLGYHNYGDPWKEQRYRG